MKKHLTPFVVTGVGRDGISLLWNGLKCDDRLRFLNWRAANRDEIDVDEWVDEHLFPRRRGDRDRLPGIRMQAYDFMVDPLGVRIREAIVKRGCHVIAMRRSDLLRQMIYFNESDGSSIYRETPRGRSITFTRNDVYMLAGTIRSRYRREEFLWSGPSVRRMEVDCDKIIEVPNRAKTVWEFLGLEPPKQNLRWYTRKADSRPTDQIVTNYEVAREWAQQRIRWTTNTGSRSEAWGSH